MGRMKDFEIELEEAKTLHVKKDSFRKLTVVDIESVHKKVKLPEYILLKHCTINGDSVSICYQAVPETLTKTNEDVRNEN